jgi:aldehyde:ferredoxin oxidoreductase
MTNLKKTLATYYKFEGWDREGIPTKSRLLELDLKRIKL